MLELSALNSLLELLTAFNFALSVSIPFLADLNTKLTGSLGAARELMKTIKTKILEVDSFIEEALKDNANSSTFLEFLKSLQTIKAKREVVKNDIRNRIHALSASRGFQRFSLFGGIYCILILFISIFEDDIVVDLFEEGLVNFNIISFVLLLTINKRNTGGVNSQEIFSVCLVFILALIISLMIFVIFEGWLDYHCTFDLTNTMYITTILLPSIHFVYAFGNALLRSRAIGRKQYKECKELYKEIDELSIQVAGGRKLQLELKAEK